ncbi:DUF72 domain-containing protein [Paenibacillus sp. OAS669]|uniref:DUF72 domain-containing protein n=1 Tax=Paenibacillus sp. OAS669 TaxID=2663821 RepID=UPI001789D55B|nr:DUF72 domain-containing protein [Paenibacillus sp. OAS669]MBE1443609.1 uncharacterized protein YecE (DUF72 family) [Paenibacillus sp. OAS669]
MIHIGLAGWGDHDDLYGEGNPGRDKLKVYSRHFPIVEVDSSFYAVQAETTYEKWVHDTPDDFGFIIKAYQGMTGHSRGKIPFDDEAAMFEAFIRSIGPVQAAGKLKTVLFQYPPWFDCTRAHVQKLREAKERMGYIPVALEFRHQSWFTPEMRDKTLSFMEKEGWMHSICDEPQAGLGSVPTVLHPTVRSMTMVRMHGRNQEGWSQASVPNWRDVRYLYRYSRDELMEWKQHLERLQEKTDELCVIFNNNSGGDAAANAKQLMELLGMQPKENAPKQLDLF